MNKKRDPFQPSIAITDVILFLRNFLLILVLFTLGACGVKNTKYYAVKQYQPRESDLGFSVTPPPGDHWYEKLNNDSLHYLKIEKPSNVYSLQTKAREVRLNNTFSDSGEFLRYVKKEKSETLGKMGCLNEKSEYKIEKSLSAYCVRYQQSYEDHAVSGLPDSSYVAVKNNGIFCLHPDNRRLGIDVSYVEKTVSDARVKSYRNEGEEFVASLTFHHPSVN